MKDQLLILFLWVNCCLSLFAQPCKKVDLADKKQVQVLKQFIHESEKKGFLKPDSGVIHLTERVDKQGQTIWYVWAQTSFDQYSLIKPFLGHCTDCKRPTGWTQLNKRIVLRYDFNNEDTLTREESGCLRELLKDHVTLTPPLAPPPKQVPEVDPQGRPVLDKNGKPKMWDYSWPIGGGPKTNNTVITFKNDGSITKALPL